MTTHMADDTLVDTSLPTSPPLPTPEPINHSSALGAPSVQSAHHPVVVPRTQLDDAAQTDVEMPSIQVPDEAALAAAAAAMAAAAQRHVDGLPQQQVTPDGIDTTDDLNSYLLAAAAASVHAQQQHNGDDHHAAQSEDSFDSTATPAPNSIYTNGTSVNGSDADDARAAIHGQCRKYTDHRAPYPLTIGKRTPGGCAEFLAHRDDSQSHAQHLEHLPFTDATVGLGKTRCYWALLSADHSKANRPTGEKLHFVYLDPVLQQHMAEQAGQMVGSDFYDYVHPEERHRVSDDMQKIVESRTLFGSVTRCRYSRLPRIRELLGAINPPRDPEADRYVEDDSFVAIDIVINWIGDGMLLCFFHAIIDKAQEDNDEQHKSEWTNWCGTPGPSFTLRQCDTLWKQVKAVPREVVPDSGPVHVFQVIEAGGDGRVLLSWPPPRLFSRDVAAHLITQSDTTVFQDGSYFADDFARLAQGVSIAPGSSSLSDANTSCTRRFRAKHTLTTEGKVRSIESVLIPYGGVILACFHTTFQQQLPPPDPKPLLHARSTLPAQPERRKAEHDVSQSSPNKRSRTEASAEQSDVAASTVSNAVDSQSTSTATQAKNAPPASSLPPATPVKNEPCAARSATRPPPPKAQTAKADYAPTSKTPVSKYIKPSAKTESSGIAALANPSLMYTNAPTKPPATPTSVARPAAERNLSTPAQNGTNGHASHAAPSPGGDSPNASQNKACTGCGKINSPEWRRGPSGHKTLCNACGLRYARSLTRRKKKKGKDGEVEFIEPTGDPSVVPKSRGGGGGSLPGVHRKNSKKRKEEEAAKAAAAATVAAVAVGPGALLPAVTSTPTGALNGTPASSSATTSSSVSATQSPPATTPAAKSASPSLVDSAKTTAAGVGAAQATVKVEQVDGSQAGASDSAAAPAPVSEPLASNTEAATATLAGDCAHSMAVSIALNAIAQATSSVPSIVAEALPLPVSNAISRAIAATIGSTDGGAGGLLTSQALSSTSNADSVLPSVPSVTIETTDDTAALDSTVSAAALQTIESVVSEALYKQLVHSSLPDAPAAVAFSNDKSNAVAVPSVADLPMVADASVAEPAIDLSHALTADAIRAAAQAAVAHGVGAEESIDSQAQT